jgi:hypothetical protein
MEHEHLLVWLEVLPDGALASRGNVVCRRHADAMVVPRGWTLDDRRESRPRLFRVADAAVTARAARNRSSRTRHAEPDEQSQLLFDELGEMERAEELIEAVSDAAPMTTPVDEEPTVETEETPWRPVFDPGDDLDGLLTTKSPLLSRAFHGLNRTDN